MALDIFNRYNPRAAAPTGDYPYGSVINSTSPGAQDGTPGERDWLNDIYGLLQRLLTQANISPSNAPDTVPLSDYMDSLQRIFPLWLTYSDSGSADVYELTAVSGSTVNGYMDGQVIIFQPGETNTGASTVEIESLGAKSITYSEGGSLDAGTLISGRYYHAAYSLADDRFNLIGVSPEAALVDSTRINGLVPRNSGADVDHDIVFGVGSARAANAALDLSLTGELIKKLDVTWAPGNDAGGRFSGVTLDPNTTYHCYLIREDSTGTIDCGFDTSFSAANRPAGYSLYRRVASILTDGSSVILQFLARADTGGQLHTTHAARIPESGLSQATGRHLLTLTVPVDIEPLVSISTSVQDDYTSASVLFTESWQPAVTPTAIFRDVGANTIGADGDGGTGHFVVYADDISQVAYNAAAFSGGGGLFTVQTIGWTDRGVS